MRNLRQAMDAKKIQKPSPEVIIFFLCNKFTVIKKDEEDRTWFPRTYLSLSHRPLQPTVKYQRWAISSTLPNHIVKRIIFQHHPVIISSSNHGMTNLTACIKTLWQWNAFVMDIRKIPVEAFRNEIMIMECWWKGPQYYYLSCPC